MANALTRFAATDDTKRYHTHWFWYDLCKTAMRCAMEYFGETWTNLISWSFQQIKHIYLYEDRRCMRYCFCSEVECIVSVQPVCPCECVTMLFNNTLYATHIHCTVHIYIYTPAYHLCDHAVLPCMHERLHQSQSFMNKWETIDSNNLIHCCDVKYNVNRPTTMNLSFARATFLYTSSAMKTGNSLSFFSYLFNVEN